MSTETNAAATTAAELLGRIARSNEATLSHVRAIEIRLETIERDLRVSRFWLGWIALPIMISLAALAAWAVLVGVTTLVVGLH
jgi:hypothetical protein